MIEEKGEGVVDRLSVDDMDTVEDQHDLVVRRDLIDQGR